MLNFLLPKTKIRYFEIFEENIESFQVFGISQINPYCNISFDNEIFVTIVDIANDSKEYDEKEGMVLTSYFTVRRCPKCKRVELIPVEMKINRNSAYLRNEENVAYGDFHNSRYNFPTRVRAYCNKCSSCFNVLIKNDDVWIKEARKIKEKDLIGSSWQQYQVD